MTDDNTDENYDEYLSEQARELAVQIDGYLMFGLITENWHLVKTSSSDIDVWCREQIGPGLEVYGPPSTWKTSLDNVWIRLYDTIAVKNKDDVVKLTKELEKRQIWGILTR